MKGNGIFFSGRYRLVLFEKPVETIFINEEFVRIVLGSFYYAFFGSIYITYERMELDIWGERLSPAVVFAAVFFGPKSVIQNHVCAF